VNSAARTEYTHAACRPTALSTPDLAGWFVELVAVDDLPTDRSPVTASTFPFHVVETAAVW